jgi:hypothetical protein
MRTCAEEIHQRIYAYDKREIRRQGADSEAQGYQQSAYEERMDGRETSSVRHDHHEGRSHGNPQQ